MCVDNLCFVCGLCICTIMCSLCGSMVAAAAGMQQHVLPFGLLMACLRLWPLLEKACDTKSCLVAVLGVGAGGPQLYGTCVVQGCGSNALRTVHWLGYSLTVFFVYIFGRLCTMLKHVVGVWLYFLSGELC